MTTETQLDLSYKRDRSNFIEKLQEFHDARGTSVGRIPCFGGQPLDLYALYNTVTSFGGLSVVTDRKKWGQVFQTLGFPPCTNAAYALRQHYSRYLEAYEKIFFFGEDAEEPHDAIQFRSNAQMFKYRRLNKAPKLGPLGEPIVDHFKRISFSLQSGLPNEVNFALNICSLLSNVSNSIFNIAKSPDILDLMLAHVGIWSKSDSQTKQLYDEWYKDGDKTFEKYWRNSTEDSVAKKIYEDHYINVENFDYVEKNEFFVSKEQKTQLETPEWSRVNQICIILYNFSFEPVNAMHLAFHENTLRFLLISSSSKYSNVSRTSLDTLDNISEHINLIGVEELFTQNLFQILCHYLTSNDKFKRVRAMSMLAKLASNVHNNKVLSDITTEDTYYCLLQTLYLPDISLILASLDALYYFSSLSECTCTKIALVHGSVELLVCLVTVRAESYGNKAIQGFRIVENKRSMFTPKNQNWLHMQEEQRRQQMHPPLMMHPMRSQYSAIPGMQRPPPIQPPQAQPPQVLPPQIRPPTQAVNPMINLQQQASAEPLVELDSEIFAAQWMSGFYEPHSTSTLLVAVIFDDYINTCKENKRNGILSPEEFTELLRTILPPHLVSLVKVGNRIGITGIQRRLAPIQVPSKIPKSIHGHLLRNKQAMAAVKKQLLPLPDGITLDRKEARTSIDASNDESNLSVADSVTSATSSAAADSIGDMRSNVSDTGAKEKDIDGSPITTPLVQSYSLEGLKTGNINECQEVVGKLKTDIQNHFVQFHTHRQQIQIIQVQIQQLMHQSQIENLPTHFVKDIQARVQSHHQQMGMHYKRLQELNMLLEQVQNKMTLYKKQQGISEDASMKDTSVALVQSPAEPFSMSVGSPISSLPNFQAANTSPLQPGVRFIAPAAVPFNSQDNAVPIQHNIPTALALSPGFNTTPTKPLRGKGSRGGRLKATSPRGRGSRGGRGSRFAVKKGVRGGLNGKPDLSLTQGNAAAGFNGMPPINGLYPNSPFQTASVTTAPFLVSNLNNMPVNEETSSSPKQSYPVQVPGASAHVNQLSHANTQPSVNAQPAQTSPNKTMNHRTIQPPNMDTNIKNYRPPGMLQASELSSQSKVAETDNSSPLVNESNVNVNSCNNETVLNKVDGSSTTYLNGATDSVIHENISEVNDSDVDTDIQKVNGDHKIEDDLKLEQSKRILTNGDLLSQVNGVDNGVRSPPKKQKTVECEFQHVINGLDKSTLRNVTTENNVVTVARVGMDYSSPPAEERISPASEQTETSEETCHHNERHSFANGSEHMMNDNMTDFKVTSREGVIIINDPEFNKTIVNGHSVDEQRPANGLCDETMEISNENNGICTANSQLKNCPSVCEADESENQISRCGTDGRSVTDKLAKELVENCDVPVVKDDSSVPVEMDSHSADSHESSNMTTEQKPSQLIIKTNGLRLDLVQSNSDFIPAAGDHNAERQEKFENPPDLHELMTQSASRQLCKCLWKECQLPPFKKAVDLLVHMIKVHAPLPAQLAECQVEGCLTGRKSRGVLISHFQENHCLVTKDDGRLTTVPIPDLRLLQAPQDLQDEDESPVTRSVRYTAALILRNIAKHSKEGRGLIMAYEMKLAVVAMSSSEAAPAVTQCLHELSCSHETDDVNADIQNL